MAPVNYKVIKQFFDKKEINLFKDYCMNKLDEFKNFKMDQQSFSPAWYNDPLMNSILYDKLNIMEQETNLKLFPTFVSHCSRTPVNISMNLNKIL